MSKDKNATNAGAGDTLIPVDLATASQTELEMELRKIEIEHKQLEIEIQREQVAQIRAKRANRLSEIGNRERATRQLIANTEARQKACNHRKGGMGLQGVLGGQGDSPKYCVIKHVLPDATYLVLCTRCFKEWYQGNDVLGRPQTAGFQEAIQYPTDNQESGSSLFRFENPTFARLLSSLADQNDYSEFLKWKASHQAK